MRRGDFVNIAMQGDLGKPRPALVIQADPFADNATRTVLPVTSSLVAAPLLRITVAPSAQNGLQKPSQVMVDRAMTVKRDKVRPAFGRIDADTLVELERYFEGLEGSALPRFRVTTRAAKLLQDFQDLRKTAPASWRRLAVLFVLSSAARLAGPALRKSSFHCFHAKQAVSPRQVIVSCYCLASSSMNRCEGATGPQ